MKNILLLIAYTLLTTTLSAQEHSKEILRDANAMVKAFAAGDYNKLLDYTYPGIFEVYGDRETFKELIIMTMDGFKEQGMRLDSISVQNPGAEFIAGTQLHSTIT
ncbi:MAG: hypothetical protein ACK4IY_10380, partial [Chitinophagales bacterium]